MIEILVKSIDIFTILLSVYYCIKYIKKLQTSSRFIIYYVFVFIYVVPLFLDYIVGLPDYMEWYNASVKYAGFVDSYNDPAVRILYDLFLIITQYFILHVGRTIRFTIGSYRKDKNDFIETENSFDGVISQKLALGSLFVSAIPPLLCILMRYPYIMIMWGWRDMQVFSSVASSPYYSTIEKLTYISIVVLICLILMQGIENESQVHVIFYKLFAIVLLFANLCIESKRSILFFAVIIFLVIKIYGWGKTFSIKKYLILCVVGIGIIVFYSVYVKMTLRGYNSMSSVYTNLRVDMFRDDTVKLVIKSLIDPSKKSVLDYPFQSYLTQIGFIFPLDFIIGWMQIKVPVVGFNTYLTSALSGSSIESGERWMTTSIGDELLANFGFLGYILLPIVLLYLVKQIDRTTGIVQIFWIGGIVLMMMYSFNYVVYYLEFALILMRLAKSNRKYGY